MPKRRAKYSGSSGATQGVFGGSSFAAAALAAESNILDYFDSGLDGEATALLKRAQKRDATTRCRALESLHARLCDLGADTRAALLPPFLFVWRKLQFDASKQCRLLTCKCAGALCSGLHKRMAPHVKQAMRVWMLCLHDADAEVASAASSALSLAFPDADKRLKAQQVCSEEACDAVQSCLAIVQAKDMQEEGMSKEEAGDILERMHVASLACTANFAHIGASSCAIRVLDETSCLKRFVMHTSAAVRLASLRALRAAVEHGLSTPRPFGSLQSRLHYVLQNESDPACVPEALALAVAVLKALSPTSEAPEMAVSDEPTTKSCQKSDGIAHGDLQHAALPHFVECSLAKCGEATGPLLLPLTACTLPPYRKQLVQAMWRAVLACTGDMRGRRALASGVCEACTYIIHTTSTCDSVSDLLFGTIGRVALSSTHESKPFAEAVARIVSTSKLPSEMWWCTVQSTRLWLRECSSESASAAPFLSAIKIESGERDISSFVHEAILKTAVEQASTNKQLLADIVSVFANDLVQFGEAEPILATAKNACQTDDGEHESSWASVAACLLAVASDNEKECFFQSPSRPTASFARKVLSNLSGNNVVSCNALDTLLLECASEHLMCDQQSSEQSADELLQAALPSHVFSTSALATILEHLNHHLASRSLDPENVLYVLKSFLPKLKPGELSELKLSSLEEIFALRLLDRSISTNTAWDEHLCPAVAAGTLLDTVERKQLLSRLATCIRAASLVSENPSMLAKHWRCVVTSDDEETCADRVVLAPLGEVVWPSLVAPQSQAHLLRPTDDISDDEIDDAIMASHNMCCIALELAASSTSPSSSLDGWMVAEACASAPDARDAFSDSVVLSTTSTVEFLVALAYEALEDTLLWALESGVCDESGVRLFLSDYVSLWNPKDGSIAHIAEATIPAVSKVLRRSHFSGSGENDGPPQELVDVTLMWLNATSEMLLYDRARHIAQVMRITCGALHSDAGSMGVSEQERSACVQVWESACRAWAQQKARVAALARAAPGQPDGAGNSYNSAESDIALASLAATVVEVGYASLQTVHWQPLLQMLEEWINSVVSTVEDSVEAACADVEGDDKPKRQQAEPDASAASLTQMALLILDTMEHLPLEVAEPDRNGRYGDLVPYSAAADSGRHLAQALAASGWLNTRTQVLKSAFRLLMCAGVLEAKGRGVLDSSSLGVGFWASLAHACTVKRSPQTVLRAAEEFELWDEVCMPAVHALYALLTPKSAADEPHRSLQHAACTCLHSSTLIEAAVMGLDSPLSELRELQEATEELHREEANMHQKIDSEEVEDSSSPASAAELACIREPLRILVEDCGERKKTLTPGDLLAWGVLAAYVTSLPAHNKWRPRLAHFISEAQSLPRVLTALAHKLPLPSNAAATKAEQSVRAAWEGAREPQKQLACLEPASRAAADLGWQGLSAEQLVALWSSLLSAFPAGVRAWFAQRRDKGGSTKLEAMTASHVSQRMIDDEIFRASSASDLKHNNNMLIKPNRRGGEVVAQYSVDESTLELTISLPRVYPLKSPEVSVTRSVGISDARLRQWQVTMSSLLRNQDGAIAAALRMWLQNVSKEFEGMEPCPICYSVVHTTSGRLPRKDCRRCKQRFHSACLLHWFNSSGRSDCPLCRYKMT
jgi:hypothetical protein